MKHLHNLFCLLSLFLLVPVYLLAQQTGSDILSNAIQRSGEKGFIGQYLKGARNGMGAALLKNGDLYVGDFIKNKYQGTGMLFDKTGENLQTTPGCAVFVGKWREGKRSGMGRCYSSDGFLIYKGTFEDDKPTTAYPLPADSLKMFATIDLGNGNYYVGETFSGIPDGFGVIINADKSMWIGRFKDGMQTGVSLMIQPNAEWLTVNANDGEYEVISSSVAYKEMNELRKANMRAALSEMFSLMGQAMYKGIEAANTYKSIKSGTYSSSSSAAGSETYTDALDTPSSAKTNSSSSTSDRDVTWMKSNYQSQKAVYSNYETQIIKMYNYPEKCDASRLKEIQRKMKKVRETIVSHGGTCNQSKWESWTP